MFTRDWNSVKWRFFLQELGGCLNEWLIRGVDTVTVTYWILLQVLTIGALELQISLLERAIVDGSLSFVWWTPSIVSPYFPVIHVLWSSKSDVWGMLLAQAGKILTLYFPLLCWWVQSCMLCWKEDECRLFTGNYVQNLFIFNLLV